jgi:hypothetical protein
MHYFVYYMTKKKEKLTHEEDADYQAPSNGALDPRITD